MLGGTNENKETTRAFLQAQNTCVDLWRTRTQSQNSKRNILIYYQRVYHPHTHTMFRVFVFTRLTWFCNVCLIYSCVAVLAQSDLWFSVEVLFVCSPSHYDALRRDSKRGQLAGGGLWLWRAKQLDRTRAGRHNWITSHTDGVHVRAKCVWVSRWHRWPM